MMALFGSVAHAPLAVMLMVAEMTGNLSMLAPAMVAVGLATFVVGDEVDLPEPARHVAPTRRPTDSGSRCRCSPRFRSATRRGRRGWSCAPTTPSATRSPGSRRPACPGLRSSAPTSESSASSTWTIARARATTSNRVGAVDVVREPILAADDGLDDALGALADHLGDLGAGRRDGGQLVGVLSVRDVDRGVPHRL